MKKAFMVLFCAISIIAISQEEKQFRLGVQLGNVSNKPKYQSGMSDANARFHVNEWGGGALSVVGRYDFDKRWMVTASLGIHSVGFGYAISENYSLLNKKGYGQYTGVKSDFAVLEMPAMVFYKFNPNCKNAKWLIGAGFSQDLAGAQTIDKSVSQATDGNSNVNYISSTSSTKGGLYWNFRWSVAREKTFKNNSILNASVLINYGFNQFAKSTVNYTIDNQTYTHTFTNNGNFVGLRLTYFFKPFVSLTSSNKKAAASNTLGK